LQRQFAALPGELRPRLGELHVNDRKRFLYRSTVRVQLSRRVSVFVARPPPPTASASGETPPAQQFDDGSQG
jgi:hypothetical protein